jgi:23S rRNA (guanosine2251-2'-O)-methyltransferase
VAVEWLEGAIAVKAALESNSRDFQAIFIHADRLDSQVASIQRQARHQAIPFERLPAEKYDALVPSEQTGGIAAQVGPRRFLTLGELLSEDTKPAIVMLDGVEDPYNFGQAIRGLYAAGVHGLVVRERNWLHATAQVARSSAGASERMPIAVANSPEEAADFFRAAGLAIACATTEIAQSMTDVDLSGPLFLVIGGEKRGISRSFLKSVDLRIAIPYGRDFPQQLGSAAAAVVLGFEIMRQRRDSQTST